MRITVIFALLLSMLTFGSSSAVANFTTGNDLLRNCTAKSNEATYYQAMAYCSAYITGAVDALEAERYMAVKQGCIPSEVTVGQLRDIVIAYLQANPSNRHLSGYVLVNLALLGAFDCSFKRGGG